MPGLVSSAMAYVGYHCQEDCEADGYANRPFFIAGLGRAPVCAATGPAEIMRHTYLLSVRQYFFGLFFSQIFAHKNASPPLGGEANVHLLVFHSR